jgi:ABC-2 type transport system permease protein
VPGIVAGFRLQMMFYRGYPQMWIPLLTAPLYTIIFTMVVRHSGRADLSSYAVVAPFFMSLWWFAIFHGGLVIQNDRWEGTLESHAAAPVGFAYSVLGRILAVMTVGLASFGEVWLFGRYVLGAPITIRHPWVLAATLLLTAFAMGTTALFFAGLFVLARSAVTFSNSASYPFYVLGGILVPVTLLPGWLQPLSRVVFLFWSARLLRASLAPAPVPGALTDLAMVAVLGCAALVLGVALLNRILRRVRGTGELTFQ